MHLRFGFDLIYGGDSEQVTLWRDVGVPAMEKAFAGQRTPPHSIKQLEYTTNTQSNRG